MATRMRPTLLLGRKTLVIASSPAMAIQARDRNEGSLPGGLPAGDPLARPLESLPSGLTLLSVDDTRQSILPELVVGLPGLVESLIKEHDSAAYRSGARPRSRPRKRRERLAPENRKSPRGRRPSIPSSSPIPMPAAISVSVGPCAGRE